MKDAAPQVARHCASIDMSRDDFVVKLIEPFPAATADQIVRGVAIARVVSRIELAERLAAERARGRSAYRASRRLRRQP